MKLLIVLFSVSTVALASLEPPGYRPPSSSYLPQHLQHEQEQHHYQNHQSHKSNPSLSPSPEYLPPILDRSAGSHSLPSQYLPPDNHYFNQQQQQQEQREHQLKHETSIPSTNYLPAVDKLRSGSTSSDYMPSTLVPHRQYSQNASTVILSNYHTSGAATITQPTNEYLPANVALTGRQLSANTNLLNNNYLAPTPTNRQAPISNNYLVPTRLNLPSATPVPRVSVLSGSPYKLDGSTHNNVYKTQQQSKFSGSRLDASSLQQNSAFLSSTNNFELKNPRTSAFNQAPNNYLSPIQSARDSYHSSQNGFQYNTGSSYDTHSRHNSEPAKYDFEYRVSDEFGNDYAHKEARMGNQIQGVYSVLLPDGRKQIVQYEANEDGFKPRISYEEVASVLSAKTPAVVGDARLAGYNNKNTNGYNTQGPY